MDIKPLGDRVLVEVLDAEEKTKGGILIPDTNKEKPQQGKVIAVGKGKISEEGKIIALEVKVGDRVLFGKYTGSELKLDDRSLLMLKEEDILGVISK